MEEFTLDNVQSKLKKNLLEQYDRQRELYDSALRSKADNLFIFNKYILGVEQGKEELGTFHKELCNFVTDNKRKKKLILLPRGHLKSTLVTIGYCVQQIALNPNIRILIQSATWQTAVDFVTEIKRHLEGNEELRRLFPEIAQAVDERTEWAQDRITVKRTDTNIKGPTVWAAGIDTNLVGSHPDMVVFDDVHNRDNTMTREQVEKVILRYRDVLDLLEPQGQLIVIGTRWVEWDLYAWLMDKDNEVSKSYEVMIRKAHEGNLETGEGFSALWPGKFSQKELLTRLREKGVYEFSALYMNNPVPSEDADFKREWFQYYDLELYRGKEMKTFITIDPAISLQKNADFTAIVVTGIDQFSNIFIKDIVRGHFKPSEIIGEIFRLNELWHPQMIILETIAYQKALAYALREEMNRRGRFLPIHEINQHEKSKYERIRGLQPIYMNKKIFHRKNIPLTIYLEEELLTFPRSRHDDLMDSFSMVLEFLSPPRPKTNRYQRSYLY